MSAAQNKTQSSHNVMMKLFQGRPQLRPLPVVLPADGPGPSARLPARLLQQEDLPRREGAAEEVAARRELHPGVRAPGGIEHVAVPGEQQEEIQRVSGEVNDCLGTRAQHPTSLAEFR